MCDIEYKTISLKENDILVISIASGISDVKYNQIKKNIQDNLKRLGYTNEVLIIDDRTDIFKIGRDY